MTDGYYDLFKNHKQEMTNQENIESLFNCVEFHENNIDNAAVLMVNLEYQN